ncbi:MAG: DUF5661 family protein [archaeon]
MVSKKEFNEEEAKIVGEQLGIQWDKFDVNQFKIGMNVELEHGLVDVETNVTNDDPIITGKIALAHLNEFSDYYDRLEKLEKEAEEFWGKKDFLT